ncbi:hypothetical protein SAMN04489712_105283 [Thermomonospora echinospora]|uniref:Uncharacterized protein n=1 Tax=Thermomonospora echinospora TaxID=1992 RepID=A0A1H6A8F1_9ACTN|nr:hypothetical protein [Thermomonospora echinospora]SEG45033.1 hypothetical protein SAMN04489712_105283 [Thermomonospora echinospora]
MAVAFVAATANAVNSTTLPLTWPAVSSGHVALLGWSGLSTAVWTPPAGWTLLDAVTADSGNHASRVYWRPCDGSESGTITLTHDTLNKQSAVLIVWSGVDTATPIDAYAVRDENTAGTSHASPSASATMAGVVAVAMVSERVTDSTPSYTAPAGYTIRAQPTPIGLGGSVSLAMADLLTGTGGATTVTPGAWTGTVSTANVLTWTILLRPLVVVAGASPVPSAARRLRPLLVR